jgi:HemY protein
VKAWRWVLLLVVIAALAAFAWPWLAEDPGYVLVRLRGWRVETTAIAALVLLLLAWALLVLLWRLLGWPFGALNRRHRRISRRRLGEGLVALMEGRHGDAERDLQRAARLEALRGPALLAAAEAASRRGEYARALEILDQAGQAAPRAARVLRARTLRRAGKPAEALALLVPEADAQTLTPGGWRELALAALAAGDLRRARSALEPLRQSGALGPKAYAELESRILTASLAAAADAAELNTLWSQLPKTQRRVPAAVEAYARRAIAFGLLLPAMDELEAALHREWSPALVRAWAALGDVDAAASLARAEGWLASHPNDPALLYALGRLSMKLGQWAKARQYLERALALAPDPAAWEALADVHAALGEWTQAQAAYRNALAVTRGEKVAAPLAEARPGVIDTRPIALEERDEHGVPRLRP